MAIVGVKKLSYTPASLSSPIFKRDVNQVMFDSLSFTAAINKNAITSYFMALQIRAF